MKKHRLSIIILFLSGTMAGSIASAQFNEKDDHESYYFNEDEWIKMLEPANFKNNTAFLFSANINDVPNILLIGNSISIGYTPTVQKALAGVANVYRIPQNGGDTKRFLENYEKWLSTVNWDVIHINIGLHDLKRLDENGNLNASNEQVIPPEEYRANLEKIFRILTETTSAKIVWATTTFIQEGSSGRISGDEKIYNQVSLEVLKEFPEIAVNDLYSKSLEIKSLQREANVHYTEEGYKKLGEAVANCIKKEIE